MEGFKTADLNRVTLVDVRTPDEYALGGIDGAVNVPLDELRERLAELPLDKPVWVYCGVGLRGYLASNILKENGYDVRNLIGGLKTYKAAVTPVCIPAAPEDVCVRKSSNTCCVSQEEKVPVARIVRIDACGIQCPGPILKLKTSMEQLQSGECLEIRATDAGFPRDAEAWCRMTGNRFVSAQTENGTYIVRVEKATPCAMEVSHPVSTAKGKTFILFSDDLDKVLATFVLANGAAATGEKVTIFFTFWGLNAIKKDRKAKSEERLVWKDVRRDVAIRFHETATFKNEYGRHGSTDDASYYET